MWECLLIWLVLSVLLGPIVGQALKRSAEQYPLAEPPHDEPR